MVTAATAAVLSGSHRLDRRLDSVCALVVGNMDRFLMIRIIRFETRLHVDGRTAADRRSGRRFVSRRLALLVCRFI